MPAGLFDHVREGLPDRVQVVQYVGRLLRTHEDKHHVELHDYVDVRIPVLDRMHVKRLPAYSTLGFDVPKRRRRT